MNPYDFVPLGEPSRRIRPPGHDVLPKWGGVIHADLETLGPFLIADQGYGKVLRPVHQGRVIPGSSLKGMLRTIAEIVGGGCISTSGSLYNRQGRYAYEHASEPRGFAPCSKAEQLCVTCRMFGALIGRDSWRGMMRIGEGRWQQGYRHEDRPATRAPFNVMVGRPKPSHHAFYVKDGKIRGRKLYYHHPEVLTTCRPAAEVTFGANQVHQVMAIEPGERYSIRIDHEGLDDDAYELLLYALFLEEGLAHKLGWGKAAGLGSVRLIPTRIEETDLRARYKEPAGVATTTKEGAEAMALVSERTSGLRNRHDEVTDAFRRLARLAGPVPEPVSRGWRYPAYGWFKDNPSKSLEAFNRGEDEARDGG